MVQCTGLSLLSIVWHCSSTSDFVCVLSESMQCEIRTIYLGGTLDRKYPVWIAGTTAVTYWSGKHSVWIGGSLSRCCSSNSSKCSQEAEDGGSAPKRIRGSAAGRCMETGFKAELVMRSHCSTWRNTSLKEPTSEDTEPYPWRVPIATEELELAPTMPLSGSNRAVASSYGHVIRLDPD